MGDPAMNPQRSTELISVVIPNFNQAQYLAQAVESVFAQPYPHLPEILGRLASGDLSRGNIRLEWSMLVDVGESS